MPDLEYFLVCRSASVDVFSDEITLSGVLEEVELTEVGYGFIPWAVAVGVWNLSDADGDTDFQAVLRITRPGETDSQEFPLNLVKGRHRLRVMLAVDVPLVAPGHLLFELLLNGRRQASHRVVVHEPIDPLPTRAAPNPLTSEKPPGAGPPPTGSA